MISISEANDGILLETTQGDNFFVNAQNTNLKQVYVMISIQNGKRVDYTGEATIQGINDTQITLGFRNEDTIQLDLPRINKKGSLILNLEIDNPYYTSWIITSDTLTLRDKIGFYTQYFTVGIIYGGLPSTIYGFFLGYLNVPAYIYASASVITSLPWSFKFIFGCLNDCYPLFGYHRKSYMILGWTLCFMFLIILATRPLPEPYYCRDENGNFLKTSKPCNPNAKESGGFFAILMMCISIGYVIADVAADGLMVQYAKKEPIEKRGTIQTNIYIIRTFGIILSSLLVGFGMNGKQYNGSFDQTLEYNTIIGLFAIPVGLMIPITYYCIHEGKREKVEIAQYRGLCWHLLKKRAFFYVLLYQFFSNFIGAISTPAGGLVKQEWAKVKNLQTQIATIISLSLFALGLHLIKRYYLNYSWRKMIFITILVLNATDMITSYFTIYDIFRNQYFYLGETILDEIPSAFNFVVSTFIIVEMADKGNEGMVYGLLTTVSNLGNPFSRAVSNAIFGLFTPKLSDSQNYIEDSYLFRHTVALSFGISYIFSFLSLAFLPLIPNQKEEAQKRKQNWSNRTIYAYISVLLVLFAFFYAVIINLLTMFPETLCYRIVGGNGC